MGWKKLVILGTVLFFISCLSFYPDPKGGYRPKKPMFMLSKKKFKYDNIIDTASVYVSIDTLKYPSFKSVFFLKFFNNGRFFMSRKKSRDYFSKKNVKPGLIGYYILDKKKVYVEYFSVDPLNKNNTEYVKQVGIVKNDTIFLRNDVDTTYIEKYVRENLNFIPEPSNW